MSAGGGLPPAGTREVCCEGKTAPFRDQRKGLGERALQNSPKGEGGEGGRWQRGAMADAATPPSLQPSSTIPLLRPTRRA